MSQRLSAAQQRRLIHAARQAQRNAYAPYSHFPVGAALLTKNGTIYTGCNVENAAYPSGICAERTAIFKAVSEGEREFVAIAVIAPTAQPVSPCGACRQVMAEFSEADNPLIVVSCSADGQMHVETLSDLLPRSFTKTTFPAKMQRRKGYPQPTPRSR
ncbi:MAG: cytidine deaminase [Abditibacteriales bacterium]|nr:cytidine deaminase [Abditibacteriales bacterium]MDW8366492.1 cytidine deaminase [Abditibacteriales bacterium]